MVSFQMVENYAKCDIYNCGKEITFESNAILNYLEVFLH